MLSVCSLKWHCPGNYNTQGDLSRAQDVSLTDYEAAIEGGEREKKKSKARRWLMVALASKAESVLRVQDPLLLPLLQIIPLPPGKSPPATIVPS